LYQAVQRGGAYQTLLIPSITLSTTILVLASSSNLLRTLHRFVAQSISKAVPDHTNPLAYELLDLSSATMRSHVLDYTHDMPEVHIMPGEHVQVRSTISLPGSHEAAAMTFQAVPFQNDDFPEQWFHGFRLDIYANPLQQYVHDALVVIARQQAVAISKRLRITRYDFAQAHV
jgi:hypothetical protein